MADTHFAYSLANGNSREARRIYAERYLQFTMSSKTFANIHRYLREKSFLRNTIDFVKPMTSRTSVLKVAILNEIEPHPETSTRKIART